MNILENRLETTTTPALTRSQEIKRILEALLISSSDPISVDKMREIVTSAYPIRTREIVVLLEELQESYKRDNRGFQLDEIGGGYLFRTTADTHPFVALYHENRRGEKLSKAALETLAIIAYKQPITRPQIEAIRGVDSSGTVASLVERGLIEMVGKLEKPGRPALYGVTTRFLQHFGLKDVSALASGP